MPAKVKSPQRVLGLWMSTALVSGNMIGSGIFLLPAALAVYGSVSLLGWLLTTLGAILLALTFAGLSRMLPKAGGPYAYTRAAFGDFPGFLVAWGYWISIWTGNAAIAVAMVGYLAVFVPVLGTSPTVGFMAALAAIWLLTWINGMGVRQSGRVQLVTTVLKLAPLTAIALVGLFFIDGANFQPFHAGETSLLGAINATAGLTLWAFLGLESATIPADAVKEPRRTIPLATILGTLVAAVVYIAGTAVVMGVVPRASLLTSTAPFADAARLMWGEGAGLIVAGGSAIACFGALNGWILLQGELPSAMARDGLFPQFFANLSPRGRPMMGLLVSSGITTLVMAMNFNDKLVDRFSFMILLATIATLVPYLFCTMAAPLLARVEERSASRAPHLILMVAVPAFIYALWAVAGAGRDAVYWGFLLLMTGIPVYALMQRRGISDSAKSLEGVPDA